MLVMVVFFIAFRWIHLSTPLIRLFLLVLILLLMPTRSEERFSRNAETDLVCRLLLEKKKKASLAYLEPPWLHLDLFIQCMNALWHDKLRPNGDSEVTS